MKFKSIITSLILSVALLGGLDVNAGSFSSGGSKSSFSSGSSSFSSGKSSFSSGGGSSWGGSSGGSKSSFSSSNSSGSKGWGNSSSAPAASKGWGNSAPAAAPAKSGVSGSGSDRSVAKSSTDDTLKSKVNSGAPVVTRSAQVSSFKADKANQTKYTSTFASEPAQRPAYIPSSERDYSGVNRTVIYDRSYGGYGYYDSFGTFLYIDALAHAATMNTYNPGVVYSQPVIAYHHHGFFYYFFMTILTICILVGAVVGIVFAVRD